MSRTLIIAEAGSCHDGEFGKAKALVEVAKSCGADVVKFQCWSSADRMAERRHAPEYRDVYAKHQLPRVWLPMLKSHADAIGIEFMCSTYLPEDVETVAPFVRRFKIASFESTDPQLIAAHDRWLVGETTLLVSCGMGSREAAERALRGSLAFPHWTCVRYLHCVSSYPTPVDGLNIAALRSEDEYGNPDFAGFSDHAAPDHTWTGALAVAAGATIIERHVRLDQTREDNADVGHAMNPRAFTEYIRHIRFAETCLGEKYPVGVQPCEAAMLPYRVRA